MAPCKVLCHSNISGIQYVCVPFVLVYDSLSAANRSGIGKGENYSFYSVASLAILVNHTPLGTCVIF